MRRSAWFCEWISLGLAAYCMSGFSEVRAADSDVNEILKKYQLEGKATERKDPSVPEQSEKRKKRKKRRQAELTDAPKPVDRSPSALEKFAPEAERAGAPESQSDKSGYSLFKPVPKDKMRDFDSDRPGVTNSPRTVDAGHLKIESGLLGFASHTAGGANAKSFTLNDLALGVGLLDSLELQAEFATYVHSSADRASLSGIGDTTLSLKLNLLGNEGGPLAVGVMGALKVPTSSGGVGNGSAEGGISLPFAFALPRGWSFGAMPELDCAKNSEGGGYHSEFFMAFVLGHSIVGNLSGLAQFSSSSSGEDAAAWIANAGGALTYQLLPNLQLDTDWRFGLTQATDNLAASTGIVLRF